MTRFSWLKTGALAFSLLGFVGCAQAQPTPDSLQTVRAYADTLIERGRDTYGAEHSPLFAATLDRENLTVFEKAPPAPGGIRNHDRALWGANPMHDQNLYQVLYALSKITGDAKYSREADAALKFFFENCQSEVTGLMTWGEHLSWGFRKDARSKQNWQDDIHEFFRPWVLWDKTFVLAPKPAKKFALGLWNHQIYDQKTGAFSRHAKWSSHGPETDSEYPRHGGFYIQTWAKAWEKTGDETFLKAIETLVGFFEKQKNSITGAIAGERKTPELLWTNSNLSLAISLSEAAPALPPPLKNRVTALADSTDAVYLKMKHELLPGGKGFIGNAVASTLEPGDKTERGVSKNGFYSRTWATGYGESTDAAAAMNCLTRYHQTKNEGYKNLVLQTARRYLTSFPDPKIEIFPQAYGEAIALLLGAYRLEKSPEFLEAAKGLGVLAQEKFFDGSALPRASTRVSHYESITRGHTLAMALLDLWAIENKPELDLGLVWTER